MRDRINPDHFRVDDRLAIEHVCAWPNLTLLPDRSLFAAIFNQPCHGQWEGDLEGWGSVDQGVTWHRRAPIALHESPGTARMNCAVGLNHDDHLIALCSGWTGRATRINNPGQSFAQSQRLTATIHISADFGNRWHVLGQLPDDLGRKVVPFGDIHRIAGSRLIAMSYVPIGENQFHSRLLESTDGGRTWSLGVVIDPQGNETALLPINSKHWIASVRRECQRQLHLWASHDAGATWMEQGELSLPGQVTSHLARLQDGRILLSYGNRCVNNMGIDARIGDCTGHRWSEPIRVADTPMRDCGYPSSVELSAGCLLTIYYTQTPGEYQYEMRSARWNLPS